LHHIEHDAKKERLEDALDPQAAYRRSAWIGNPAEGAILWKVE